MFVFVFFSLFWDRILTTYFLQQGYICHSVPGYNDVAGKALKSKIQICVLPVLKLFSPSCAEELEMCWPTRDYEDALGGGSMDLSNVDILRGESGKAHGS